MNPRTTMILALLALILTTLAFRSVRDSRPTFVVGVQRPLNFAIPAVKSLLVERGDSERIEMRSSDSEGTAYWQITQPVSDPGRYAPIEDLLVMLRDVESFGEGPADLTSVGLDTPEISVTIQTGSKKHTLQMGADHSSFSRVHATIDGNSVLIDRGIRNALRDFKLSEIREDAVVGLNPDTIIKCVLERPDKKTLELKREGPYWKMLSPRISDANDTRISDWLGKLSQWAVIDFIDDPSTLGSSLDNPRAKLTLETRSGSTKTISVGAVYAVDGQASAVEVQTSDRDCVLIVAGSTAEQLVTLNSNSLISPYLIRFDGQTVERVELKSGQYGPVSSEKNPTGGWTLNWAGDGSIHTADPSVVGDWINALLSLRAETWQEVDTGSLQKWGFDRPLLELNLSTGMDEKERLLIGSEVPDQEGVHYVWNPRGEACAITPVPFLEEMRSAPFSLRSRQLSRIPGELLRFRITVAGGGPLDLVRPHQNWRVVSSTEPSVKSEDFPQLEISAISKRMGSLQVARWLDPGDAAPDESDYEIRLDWLPESGSDPVRTCFLGGRTSEGWIRCRMGQGEWGFGLAPVSGIDLEALTLQVYRQLTEQP